MNFKLTLIVGLVALIASVAASDKCVYETATNNDDDDKKPMPGGLSSSIDDETKDTVTRLVNKLWNEATSGDLYHHLTCLRSVQSQVVAGVKYVVKVEFTESQCAKSSTSYDSYSVEKCPANSEYETGEPITHECTVEVWSKPWEKGFDRITGYKCNSQIQLNIAKNE